MGDEKFPPLLTKKSKNSSSREGKHPVKPEGWELGYPQPHQAAHLGRYKWDQRFLKYPCGGAGGWGGGGDMGCPDFPSPMPGSCHIARSENKQVSTYPTLFPPQAMGVWNTYVL